MRLFTILPLLSLSLMACKSKTSPAPSRPAVPKVHTSTSKQKQTAAQQAKASYVKRGKGIAQSSFQALKKALVGAMKEGGPTKAIEVCSTQAMPLTKQLSDQHKVMIQRVSHRARNPKNQANALEQDLLKAYSAMLKQKKSLRPTLEQAQGKVVFYAPIVLNKGLCLLCHGDPKSQIPAPVMAQLKQRYPKDKATGFKLGDIRGMWKVTFP